MNELVNIVSMFSKHNLWVELDSFIPASRAMLSHNDLTIGELNVDSQTVSVGIFRITSSPSLTHFLKQSSASSTMAVR